MPKKRLSKSSLLWFIRSRSYVSIPDIRRRFNLDDLEEVSPFVTAQGRIYVGLPPDATRALGDLARENRIGLELQPGLMAKVAIGVYVMPQARDRFNRAPGSLDGFHRPDEPEIDDATLTLFEQPG